MHGSLISQINQKENKFFEGQKAKSEQYAKILKIVAAIEKEVNDQTQVQMDTHQNSCSHHQWTDDARCSLRTRKRTNSSMAKVIT